MQLFGIFGAGGFGREVRPLAQRTLPIEHGEDFELIFVVEGEVRSLAWGAVVTKSVPPYTTVVDNPARVPQQNLR